MESLRPYCGDLSQLASATAAVLADGPAAGVRTMDVRTLRGLAATVLVDRALDLGPTWSSGVPIGWVSAPGIVHPAYATDDTWLRSFGGGLLTTAGLLNVGAPGDFEGEHHGLHGRISNTPATGVHAELVDDQSGGHLVITGQVRETAVYGPDLILSRRLVFHIGEPVVEIHDEITNRGWAPSPMMILYHFNIGFPVVAPGARIIIASTSRQPLDDVSAAATDSWDVFTSPTVGANAEVFEHTLTPGGPTSAAIVNENDGTGPAGILIRWDAEQLPHLLQWRMLGRGMYLTGIEPANCRGRGIAREAADGTIPILEPGESRKFDLRVQAAGNNEQLASLVAAAGLAR